MRAEDLGIVGLDDIVRIGSGGFGTVYRARQADFDRVVAIKVLPHANLDEIDRVRFERERRSLGSLSGHPNIVTVYTWGYTTNGDPYLVMDFLSEGSLSERLGRDGPVPWQEAAAIMVKVAGAVETAHRAGVLHRDIKPANVLMSRYGEPALADFGIARVRGDDLPTSTQLTTSPAHAAPELLSGAPPSIATDIYALGSTLYTLLAGRPPFSKPDDDSILPMLARIASADPPDLRPMGVPDPLWQVLAAVLAKDPSRRPPSAAAFGEWVAWAAQQSGAVMPEMRIEGATPRGTGGGGAVAASTIDLTGRPGEVEAPTQLTSVRVTELTPPTPPGGIPVGPPASVPPAATAAGAPPATSPPATSPPPTQQPPPTARPGQTTTTEAPAPDRTAGKRQAAPPWAPEAPPPKGPKGQSNRILIVVAAVLVVAAAVVGVLAFTGDDPQEAGTNTDTTTDGGTAGEVLARPEPGECREAISAQVFSAASDNRPPISCNEPHGTETVAVPDLPPTVAALERGEVIRQMSGGWTTALPEFKTFYLNDCVGPIAEFLGLEGTEADAFATLPGSHRGFLPLFLTYLPNEEQWNAGERWMRCDAAILRQDAGGSFRAVRETLQASYAPTIDTDLRTCAVTGPNPSEPYVNMLEVPCTEPHDAEEMSITYVAGVAAAEVGSIDDWQTAIDPHLSDQIAACEQTVPDQVGADRDEVSIFVTFESPVAAQTRVGLTDTVRFTCWAWLKGAEVVDTLQDVGNGPLPLN